LASTHLKLKSQHGAPGLGRNADKQGAGLQPATLRLMSGHLSPVHGRAMADLRTETLPRASSLWSLNQRGDFLDCYSVESRLTPQEAAQRGLALPSWARALLALRNALVRPFGLKTGQTVDAAIFPVVRNAPEEIILGTDDRHLNFRIVVHRQGGRLYMSTWVHPHNLWGRAYLAVVMPFHILINRAAVRRMAS
jgi:hypothetical protein